MKHKPLPTQEELRNRFDYDPCSGRLVYKSHPSRNQAHRIGLPAGSRHAEGGWVVRFNHGSYLHCRLVWMWCYGNDPSDLEIDHIDGNRANDRIENLRLATREQQQWNVAVNSRNTSGIKGVSFYRRLGLWRADIQVSGKRRTLGYYRDQAEAIAAYRSAATELHGAFARFT